MKFTATFACLAFLPFPCYAQNAVDCGNLDEALVYCPAPEAPRKTELEDGFVLLEYTVQTDGSVSNIKVLEADPPGMWDHAAKMTIAQWRYKPAEDPMRKTQRFDFTFTE